MMLLCPEWWSDSKTVVDVLPNPAGPATPAGVGHLWLRFDAAETRPSAFHGMGVGLLECRP
jgi:hypothetical protein